MRRTSPKWISKVRHLEIINVIINVIVTIRFDVIGQQNDYLLFILKAINQDLFCGKEKF